MAKRKLPILPPPRPTEGTEGSWVFLAVCLMGVAYAFMGTEAFGPFRAIVMGLNAAAHGAETVLPALGWIAAGLFLWAIWGHATANQR
jgi:hypothetical protein